MDEIYRDMIFRLAFQHSEAVIKRYVKDPTKLATGVAESAVRVAEGIYKEMTEFDDDTRLATAIRFARDLTDKACAMAVAGFGQPPEPSTRDLKPSVN